MDDPTPSVPEPGVTPSAYYAAPAVRKHRFPLTTRTRLTGAFVVAASILLFVWGESYAVWGLVPVRWLAVFLAFYRGLPYLLLPKVFETSAKKLLGADAPPELEEEEPRASAASRGGRSAR
jgi:hypothetical protein